MFKEFSTPVAGHATILLRGMKRPSNLKYPVEYVAAMVSNAGIRVTLHRRIHGPLHPGPTADSKS
nr:hypothetical protein [Thiocapsa sp. KS1]